MSAEPISVERVLDAIEQGEPAIGIALCAAYALGIEIGAEQREQVSANGAHEYLAQIGFLLVVSITKRRDDFQEASAAALHEIGRRLESEPERYATIRGVRAV
jgi:hypothetical protein